MVHNLVHNLCESLVINIGDIADTGKRTPPTPITYLTQWKIVGNSEVHGVGNLTSWKVSGNSVVDNNTILSCGDLGQDGKYHVKISNGVTIYDIALDEPLKKVNDIADTIEFADGVATVTRCLGYIADLGAYNYVTGDTYQSTELKCMRLNSKLSLCKSATTNGLCAIYNNGSTYQRQKSWSISSGSYLNFYDPDYNMIDSPTAFKAYISGYSFIYELNTPTTETIQVPDIAVSPTDTYTSANVVSFSAFEHTENKEIWSCGEYSAVDGKYHILVQPLGGSVADIALTEPLRKVSDVADIIEFPSGTEGKALVTRNVDSKIVTPFCDKAGNQIVTTLVDGVNIAWQQLVENGCFSDLTAWTDMGITGDVSVSDNILTITTTATGDKWVQQIISVNPASGDKLIVKVKNFHDLRQNRIFRVIQNSNVKVGIAYTDSNTWNTHASIFTSASSSPFYVRLQGTDTNTGVMKFKDVTMYNLTSMLPSSIVSQITSYQNFETMFHSENSQELGYVDYSSQPVNVITYGGKLYKDSVSGIEILVPLTTPTTELVDAPQIEEAESYTCEISQGAKAVEWSSFETN